MRIEIDDVAALLTYAEAEIETRIAQLKDATGKDRTELETEIIEGQEVLTNVRTQMEAGRVLTDALRKPYYFAADGVALLKAALTDESLKDDTGLLGLITTLDETMSVIHRHITDRYNWD